MLRVLFKIDRVCVRIKEAVELRISIKKGHKYLSYCKGERLINGQMILNKSSEFFISQQSPSFDIEIYLVKGALKKHGGIVTVNLSPYAMNASHRKTPLPDSTLDMDFVYMLTNQAFEGEELVSQEEIQSIEHKAHLNQISKQNDQLVGEKNRLSQEIRLLKTRNEEMMGENLMMEEGYEVRRQEREHGLQDLEQEKSSARSILEQEKQRIAEILDIINESSNYELINQIQGIITNLDPSSNQPFPREQ